MHTIKKPFVTYKGQFEPDKESLAVGIDWDALKGDGVHELRLTSEPEKIYYKSKEFLRNFTHKKGKLTRSKYNGSMIAIFPLDIFEVRESPQKSLF